MNATTEPRAEWGSEAGQRRSARYCASLLAQHRVLSPLGSRALHAAPRCAAFTLLEMMIVLVIAGIIASAATLTLSRNPHRDLHEEANRLALLFESADDEAQLRDEPLAWKANADGFQFFVERDNVWRPLADALYAPHRWSTPISSVAIRYADNSQNADQLEFGVEAINAPTLVTLYSPLGHIGIASAGDGRFAVVP